MENETAEEYIRDYFYGSGFAMSNFSHCNFSLNNLLVHVGEGHGAYVWGRGCMTQCSQGGQRTTLFRVVSLLPPLCGF